MGSLMSWVIKPFITTSDENYGELTELIEAIIEWWDDTAKPRERIGEVIEVEGMRSFLDAIGVDPMPQQVFAPRKEPFFFWDESDFAK